MRVICHLDVDSFYCACEVRPEQSNVLVTSHKLVSARSMRVNVNASPSALLKSVAWVVKKAYLRHPRAPFPERTRTSRGFPARCRPLHAPSTSTYPPSSCWICWTPTHYRPSAPRLSAMSEDDTHLQNKKYQMEFFFRQPSPSLIQFSLLLWQQYELNITLQRCLWPNTTKRRDSWVKEGRCIKINVFLIKVGVSYKNFYELSTNVPLLFLK